MLVFALILLQSNLNTEKGILLHITSKFNKFKKWTGMLYQRLINLISTSYLSLLAQFCHIDIATSVHSCVYNSVLYVCVFKCVCLFCTLHVLVCNPFLGVCGFDCIFGRIIDFISCICRNMFCVSHTSSYMRVCGGWAECVYFALCRVCLFWYFRVSPLYCCAIFFCIVNDL